MAFTKIAATERKLIDGRAKEKEMVARGWLETRVPAYMLEQLGIEYEHVDGGSRYSPMAHVYAPVWVHGVWLHAAPRPGETYQLDTLKALLQATRDDSKEREMVSAELSLDIGIPRPVRAVARIYVELMQQERRCRENL